MRNIYIYTCVHIYTHVYIYVNISPIKTLTCGDVRLFLLQVMQSNPIQSTALQTNQCPSWQL